VAVVEPLGDGREAVGVERRWRGNPQVERLAGVPDLEEAFVLDRQVVGHPRGALAFELTEPGLQIVG